MTEHTEHTTQTPRTFTFHRTVDHTGATITWPPIEDAITIHGHNGDTTIVWD